MTLTPEGAGTRLRVVERGFGDLDLPETEQAQHVKDNTEGWLGGSPPPGLPRGRDGLRRGREHGAAAERTSMARTRW